MKTQTSELKRRIRSKKEWRASADPWLIEHFLLLGFKRPKDFMRLRLFDFLNLDCVDNNRAEEMIVGLSRFLYPGKEKFGDSSPRRRAYCRVLLNILPHPSDMTIKDLISEMFFTVEEMLEVFDYVTQCFYKSGEYDNRNYKYWNIKDIPKAQRT